MRRWVTAFIVGSMLAVSAAPVATAQLDNLDSEGPNMRAALDQMPKVMIFIVSSLLRPDLTRIFR